MSSTWLFLMTPWMKGAAVRRWQEQLIEADFALGDGADGIFGPETDSRTRQAQAWLGEDADGIVGEKTLYAMQTKLGGVVPPPVTDPHLKVINGVEVWDYRGEVAPPSNGREMREWAKISGITHHRTACVLGETPSRYFPVNCHIGVTMGGRIVLAHPWELMIWHGHGLSRWTIGIEWDGNPEGKPGYFWKPGGGPHDITAGQLKAAPVLLQLLKEAFAANGQKIQWIVGHRQGSADRECDPGWQCWQKIAIPWMAETGAIPNWTGGDEAKVYAGDVTGSGLYLPYEWDARSQVPFWK